MNEKGIKKILKPFQQAGAQFLASRYHALLADEMGLGKTVQAIAAAQEVGARDVLVVCPASVRSNWESEIEECFAQGPRPNWNIVSYNGAVNYRDDMARVWDLLILDEVHFLKTPESQRTQAIFGNKTGIARRAKRIWGLTGTPVLNRPRELYPILKTLASPAIAPYDSFPKFTQRFCGAYFDGRGINTKGASHLDDLSSRLSSFMLRRTKEEVLPELPPRIVTRVALDLTAEDLEPVYAEESNISNREAYLSPTHEDYAALGDLARLLRVTGEAKVRGTAEFVRDILETEEKVVVFAYHRSVIERLSEELTGYGVVQYHGGMNDKEKASAVQEFKGVGKRIFVGQITAAGTGINGLQEVCSCCVFGELSWVPGVMDQAMGRLHRMGQRGSAGGGVVNCYLLHAPGTLESAVLGVQDGKTKVIDRLMGAGSGVWG